MHDTRTHTSVTLSNSQNLRRVVPSHPFPHACTHYTRTHSLCTSCWHSSLGGQVGLAWHPPLPGRALLQLRRGYRPACWCSLCTSRGGRRGLSTSTRYGDSLCTQARKAFRIHIFGHVGVLLELVLTCTAFFSSCSMVSMTSNMDVVMFTVAFMRSRSCSRQYSSPVEAVGVEY